MPRTLGDARRWQQDGTRDLLAAASSLDEEAFNEPSGLPGWTRKHLLAHVAANSDALQNLVHWAATGEETPMYASPEARTAGIENGITLPAGELLKWLHESASKLEADMSALTLSQWQTKVVTAIGRTVPASETAWMRTREVLVHTVDLATGITFADLPSNFLPALQEDIGKIRGGVSDVRGTPADVTAYLAGRPYENVQLSNGDRAPDLGPWL